MDTSQMVLKHFISLELLKISLKHSSGMAGTQNRPREIFIFLGNKCSRKRYLEARNSCTLSTGRNLLHSSPLSYLPLIFQAFYLILISTDCYSTISWPPLCFIARILLPNSKPKRVRKDLGETQGSFKFLKGLKPKLENLRYELLECSLH